MKEMIVLPALCACIGSIVLWSDSGSGIALGISLGTGLLFGAIICDNVGEKIIAAIAKERMREGDLQIVQASAQAAYSAILALQKEKKEN